MKTPTLCRGSVPIAALFALSISAGCKSKQPEPEPVQKTESPAAAAPTPEPAAASAAPEPAPSAAESASAAASASAAPSAGAATSAAAAASGAAPSGKVVVVAKGGPDPLAGKFTLAQAVAGLTGKGKLVAEIHTEKGTLECDLYEDKAPITVANFVGLARGLRPFKDPSGNWVKKAGYDGTTFHRVIKGFMIQGGDPLGNGTGEPGYVIPDEIWEGAKHDQRGLLCMANRGKDTNGMQFFITDGAAPHLDGGYTIFGKCQPDSVIEQLASVPVAGDQAQNPTKIEKVVVRRGAAAGAPAKKKPAAQ